MSRPRIAAVTIGQTPRPDLLEPLVRRAGGESEIIEVGALDGLSATRIASLGDRELGDPDAYPLTTRLRDGSRVTLDERVLAPFVQDAIDRAERAGAHVTLLLCAGGFLDVRGSGPLVRPFEAAAARLGELGARRIAVVVPFEGQAQAARRKWEDAGFETIGLVGEPASIAVPPNAGALDAVVLDYVGHPSSVVATARQRAAVPVIDLGECGAEAAAAIFASRLAHPAAAR